MTAKKSILVSACLLGMPCRYDGASKPREEIIALKAHHELIPVCPEQLGGLPTPRPPAERQGNRVMTREGTDVTAQYRKGAEEALQLCRLFGCDCAVLKERSPSCGCSGIYDGSFSGRLTEGQGVTAALLTQAGIRVYGESEAGEL